MKKTKDIIGSPRYDFDDMEIMVGDYLYQVVVPYDAPEELITNVTAAVVATSGRFKSIDYVRKEYRQYWNCPGIDEERKEFLLASNIMKEEIFSVSEIFTNGVVRSSHLGLLAAEGALLRLSASFKAALYLAKKGFVFEALAICRLILEQMAWALSIHKSENEHTIVTTKASECINDLKKIIPASGKIYGFLCKMTHLSPEYHGEYLKEVNGKMAVIYSSKESSYSAVLYILKLTDIYRIISEYISWDFIETHHACKKNSTGGIEILSKRPMEKVIRDFQTKFMGEKI